MKEGGLDQGLLETVRRAVGCLGSLRIAGAAGGRALDVVLAGLSLMTQV